MYVTPDGTQTAPYAGLWWRFAGSFIDWVVCFFAPVAASSFALGAISDGDDVGWVLGPLWLLFVVSCFVGYFTYFLARGQTLGMKVVGIQIVHARTGRPPGPARALVRAVLALVVVAAAAILLSFGFSDPPEGGYSVGELAVVYAAGLVFAGGVLGRLWMIWDPRKQTLQDRVTGVVVVGKMAAVGEGAEREGSIVEGSGSGQSLTH